MRQTRTRTPALVRTALSALAHSSRRLQSKSKSGQGLCAHTRGLTLPSRGRPPAGFARLRPPLTSNVRQLVPMTTLVPLANGPRRWVRLLFWPAFSLAVFVAFFATSRIENERLRDEVVSRTTEPLQE